MARRIWEQYMTLPYWPMRDHTANTYLVMLLEGMTNKVRRGAEWEHLMAKKMKTMDGTRQPRISRMLSAMSLVFILSRRLP